MACIIKITPPGTKGSSLHSLEDALGKIKKLKDSGKLKEEVRILCGGGIYPVRKTCVITGDLSVPLTIASLPGEKAVFDGGYYITDWEKTHLNGKNVWMAKIPRDLAPDGFLRAFYVNGTLAKCASFPKDLTGGFTGKNGGSAPETDPTGAYDHFYPEEKDFSPEWYNLPGMELLFIQKWTETYMRFKEYTPDGALHFRCPTSLRNYGWDQTFYFFRNGREALTEEGEYYFDNTLSRLFYRPRKGEKPDRVEAVLPAADMLMLIKDTSTVTLKDLTFRHGGRAFPELGQTYDIPGEKIPNYFAYSDPPRAVPHPARQAAQGASQLPGILTFAGAQQCIVESCTVENSSWYGILIAGACSHIRVDSCILPDLGGGGIIACGANHAKYPSLYKDSTHHLTLCDNHIHHCGQIFLSSTGILLGHVRGTLVEHNEIHDLYYSGISCGWTWGYMDAACRENRILFNKIHDLGKKVLCDMGGVYMLGVQAGSRVSHNHIYNIECRCYGGWALYTDEGSSHMVLENNVTHDCSCEGYHHQYGRENILRGNVFVGHKHNGICLSVGHDRDWGYDFPGENFTNNCNFFRNVIVTNGNPALFLTREEIASMDHLYCDSNIYFDLSGKRQKTFADVARWTPEKKKLLSFSQWQKYSGHDRNSLFTDPGFTNLEKRDLHVREDSILRKKNFPDPGVTLDQAGIRKKEK